MPNKKKKKKLDFANMLVDKLKKSGLGEVTAGHLGDDSCKWVSLRVDNTELVFTFDIKGKNIESIALYKDKVQVTDQTRIWGS